MKDDIVRCFRLCTWQNHSYFICSWQIVSLFIEPGCNTKTNFCIFDGAIVIMEYFMSMFEDRCILMVLKEHILKPLHYVS